MPLGCYRTRSTCSSPRPVPTLSVVAARTHSPIDDVEDEQCAPPKGEAEAAAHFLPVMCACVRVCMGLSAYWEPTVKIITD